MCSEPFSWGETVVEDKDPRKLRFFTWQVLHSRIGTLDRPFRKMLCWLSLFVASCAGRPKKTWIIFSCIVIFPNVFEISFLVVRLYMHS